MADITPGDQQGQFMPFDVPHGANRGDPFASADRSLCWADDWTPYIIGALKVLTRPETWHGTEDAIKDACLAGHALIAGISDSCGGVEALPFACPGDVTTGNSQPFGTWTPGFVGEYESEVGYRATTAISGGRWYTGVRFTIHLTDTLFISAIKVHYDLTLGSYVDGAEASAEVFDLTNSTDVPTRINLSAAISGDGLIAVFTPVSHMIQDLIVFLCSGTDGADVVQGDCRITAVELIGTYTPPQEAPCIS